MSVRMMRKVEELHSEAEVAGDEKEIILLGLGVDIIGRINSVEHVPIPAIKLCQRPGHKDPIAPGIAAAHPTVLNIEMTRGNPGNSASIHVIRKARMTYDG